MINITQVPMFAGRKEFIATAEAYEASTRRKVTLVRGRAARRIPSQASAARVVCAVCRTIPAAIAQAGSSPSLSKSLSIQSSTGTPTWSSTKTSRMEPPTQATILRIRRLSGSGRDPGAGTCSDGVIAHLVEADSAPDLDPPVAERAGGEDRAPALMDG